VELIRGHQSVGAVFGDAEIGGLGGPGLPREGDRAPAAAGVDAVAGADGAALEEADEEEAIGTADVGAASDDGGPLRSTPSLAVPVGRATPADAGATAEGRRNAGPDQRGERERLAAIAARLDGEWRGNGLREGRAQRGLLRDRDVHLDVHLCGRHRLDLGPLSDAPQQIRLLRDALGEGFPHHLGEQLAEVLVAPPSNEREEGPAHLGRGLEAVAPVFGQRPRADLHELRRSAASQVAQARRRFGQDRHERRRLTPALEHAAAARELEEHDAERKHVRPAVERHRPELLRREVLELPTHGPGFGARHTVRRRRDAEIDDVNTAGIRHEDVLRRHVSMHDFERASLGGLGLVRGVQTGARLCHDVRGKVEGDLLAARRHPATEARDGLALEKLHHHEELVAVAPELVDVDQVRVA
jgi:hypothetical protein